MNDQPSSMPSASSACQESVERLERCPWCWDSPTTAISSIAGHRRIVEGIGAKQRQRYAATTPTFKNPLFWRAQGGEKKKTPAPEKKKRNKGDEEAAKRPPPPPSSREALRREHGDGSKRAPRAGGTKAESGSQRIERMRRGTPPARPRASFASRHASRRTGSGAITARNVSMPLPGGGPQFCCGVQLRLSAPEDRVGSSARTRAQGQSSFSI